MYLFNYGVKYDWFLTGFIKFLKVHAYPALVFPQTLRANFVFWFFNGIPLPSSGLPLWIVAMKNVFKSCGGEHIKHVCINNALINLR